MPFMPFGTAPPQPATPGAAGASTGGNTSPQRSEKKFNRPGDGRNKRTLEYFAKMLVEATQRAEQAAKVVEEIPSTWETVHDIAMTVNETTKYEKLEKFKADQKRKRMDLLETSLEKYGKMPIDRETLYAVRERKDAMMAEREQKRRKIDEAVKVGSAVKMVEQAASFDAELVKAEEEGRVLEATLVHLRTAATNLRAEIAEQQKLAAEMAHVVPKPLVQRI